MSEDATPSALLARGFPPDLPEPDFARWFDSVPLAAAIGEIPAVPAQVPLAGTGVPEPAPRARPSESGHGSLPGTAVFAEAAGLNFGTAVHEILAGIEWFPTDLRRLDIPDRAVAGVVRKFLAAPEIAPVFERPSPGSVVWRERSVVCRLGGSTYSAQMDRVIVTPPAGDGSKGRILLVDFKTDQGEPEEIAGRYRSQLEIYAQILAEWSQGGHEIRGAVATVRRPALITVC